MVADIVSGETASADVLFLIAVILFVVSAIGCIANQAVLTKFAMFFLAVGLAVLALGFLVL